MKKEIHPSYTASTVTCACGNVFETNSTKPEIKVDVCSKCHPYWTGNIKHNTTGGRADKFKKKYGIE
jgi:large subunit ribosomal protein L31